MTNTLTKILLVDDDLRLRNLLERYFVEQGMAVRAVADGKALDAALQRDPYDVLVLDWMLPGEDGLSICRPSADLASRTSDRNADGQGRRD